MKTKLAKAAYVLAKILEIICALATLGYLASFALSLAQAAPASRFAKLLAMQNHGELSVQGFDINILNGESVVSGMLTAFTLVGTILFAIRTMMFRNVELILKTAAGKTSFSKGETPFQKDIIRMVREIGILYILIPTVQIAACIICRAFFGEIEIGVHAESGIAGFIILSFLHIFSFGETLETEVDRLI